MKANTKMKTILGQDIQNLDGIDVGLDHRLLVELGDTEFVEVGDLVVVKGNYQPSPEPVTDPTGRETLVNKWYIDELLHMSGYSESFIAKVGIRFAQALQAKLLATLIAGNFRVIVSVTDPPDESLPPGCVVRCHRLRPGSPWLREDLEGYKNEALLVIDWTNPTRRT